MVGQTQCLKQERLVMSKERELSVKIANVLADQFVKGFCDDRMVAHFAEAIKKELLAQPEQPMTGEEISQGFRTNHDATNAQSYWAGVELAEKHHGIRTDDER